MKQLQQYLPTINALRARTLTFKGVYTPFHSGPTFLFAVWVGWSLSRHRETPPASLGRAIQQPRSLLSCWDGFLVVWPQQRKETKNTHQHTSESVFKLKIKLRRIHKNIYKLKVQVYVFLSISSCFGGSYSNCNTTGMNRRQAADPFTENSPASFTKRETAESLKSFTSTVGKSWDFMVGLCCLCEKMVAQSFETPTIYYTMDINKNIAFFEPQKNGEKKLQVGGMLFLPQSQQGRFKRLDGHCFFTTSEAKRHSQCSSRPTWLPSASSQDSPMGFLYTSLKTQLLAGDKIW